MKKVFKIVSLVVLPWLASSSYAMTPLNDTDMADQTGQSLLTLSNIGQNDASNPMPGQSIGFYKLAIEGTVELNANIKKLQLGCGGTNGAGGCDIDIDNVSLSGNPALIGTDPNSAVNRANRAQSDAKLINPFIQFAIKNPNSASTRQVVGLNLGAQSILGSLTFGTENSATPNGINSLSGYLLTAPTVGTALVNGFGNATNGDPARTQLNQSDGYDAITGKACCIFGFPLGFTTTSYNLNLLDKATGSNILVGDLTMAQQVITGSRINSATLFATATVRDIALTGKLSANAGGLINLNNKDTSGTIKNLIVDTTINESLGLFHKADLNGTAAGLSLQSQAIKYPGAVSVAQKGWWLELSNPIDIGRIDPTLKVDIPQATLNASLGQVSAYLDANPVQCGTIIAQNCLLGSAIPVGTVDLLQSQHAPLTLTNLQLVNQAFAPNCYGGLKFC